MPTRRTQIIDALRDHLVINTDVEDGNCQRFWVYLHEINDFPFIAFLPRSESRQHLSANRKLAIITVLIRGYTYDGDSPIVSAEDFGLQIERAVDSFSRSNTALGYSVHEARVVQFRTDEGLFKPYAIADVEAEILYEVSNEV